MLILAHPNDPNGTSLVSISRDLTQHARIIKDNMLFYRNECTLDGIECWHPRHDKKTTDYYLKFAREHNLIVTGGSDCHQKPVIMGSVDVPDYVAEQFLYKKK
jgi:hypothetical protein